MDIIQGQLTSFWLLSRIGAAVFVGLAVVLLTGIPARTIEVIERFGTRRRIAQHRRAKLADPDAADAGGGSGRMGR